MPTTVMVEPGCAAGDATQRVDAIERAVRSATAALEPGIERAGVAIAAAVRVLAVAAPPPNAIARHRADAPNDACALALDRCAALLQEALGSLSLPAAAARGVATTVLALTTAELERPGGGDTASVVAASTVMLRSIARPAST